MSLSRASAVYVAPIPLRLILAITFAWAGVGKLAATMNVQGEDAALLANMGVSLPAPQSSPPPAVQAPTPSPDQQAQPEAAPPPAPADTPDTRPASQPEPPPADTAPGTADPRETHAPFAPLPLLLQTAPAQPAPTGPATDAPRTNPAAPTNPAQQPTALAYSADDFPDPIEVQRVYGLALLTYKSAHPAPDDAGNPRRPIWPEWAARDHWPATLAWTAAITELVAAVLVFVGLFTRLGALAIAVIMLTAAWLTEMGPAVQIGDTLFGFLPNHGAWDTNAWKSLLWQMALFCAALSLAFAGPGALSLDRAIGSGRRDDDLDDDDE